MGWGSCHLTCECSEGGPGVFRKLSFSRRPPPPPHTHPIFQAEAAWSFLSHSQSQRRGFVGWEGGESERNEPGEGKGGTLPPSCLVQEQPEQQQQQQWERCRLVVVRNWHNLTSTWKTLLAGNCGSSTEPLEYIVSIRAHYPIGGVNKEGIPLSQLPQQRRKGEEQSWWEEKWSERRGGEGCSVRGEEDIVCLWLWATAKHELSGHVRVCSESVFVCVACGNEWTWLSVRWREHACARGGFSLGCWSSEAVQRMLKQSWISSPLTLLFLFFFEWWLRTGWIPLLMLFGSTVLQGKFGSRKLQTAKTATSSGLAQGRVWSWTLLVSHWGSHVSVNEWCDWRIFLS